MPACSRCGGEFPDNELSLVIDLDAADGPGNMTSQMCEACVRKAAEDKGYAEVARPKATTPTYRKWWQFWK